jgi:hypothetical protein
MTKHDDRKDHLISKLQKDWEALDEIGLPTTPSQKMLKEQLIMAKQEAKRAFHKELSLFIFIALVTLTVLTTAVFQSPIIFIGTQVLALIVAPLIFLLLSRRKSKGSILS